MTYFKLLQLRVVTYDSYEEYSNDGITNIMIDFKTVMVILRSILVQRKQDYGT